jgi:hypothetical protein
VKIPGVGKILTRVSLTPTVSAWQQVVADLTKKYKAAAGRLSAWNRSLAKAKKAKYPNKAVISHISQQIGKVKRVMADIKADIGTALSEINQLKADARSPDEVAAGELTDLVDRGAEVGVNASANVGILADIAASEADARAAAADTAAAADRALVDVPADIRLAAAFAAGTPGTEDDIAVLRREQTYLQGALTQVQDIENRIAIVNELNSVNASLEQLVAGQQVQIGLEAQAAQALVASLNSIYRDYAGNIGVGPAPGSGAGRRVLVQQYFNAPPVDSHPLMRSAAFAAEAAF